MTEHTKDAGDLLPCPFCGGEAACQTKGLDEKFAYADKHFVGCMTCVIGFDRVDDQNPKGGYALGGTGRPKAIAAWNRRAPTPEAAALILAKEALASFAPWDHCWPGNINLEAAHAKATSALDAINKLGVK